jgi:hypothetical protein
MAQTIFNNPFPVPKPFTVGHDNPGNIVGIPAFSSNTFKNGTAPSVSPPQGPKPQSYKGILGNLLPRSKPQKTQ